MSKLFDIIGKGFTEDDKKRHKIEYDLGDTIDKMIKRIRKLSVKDLAKDD